MSRSWPCDYPGKSTLGSKNSKFKGPKAVLCWRTVSKMEIWRGQMSGLMGMVRRLEIFLV